MTTSHQSNMSKRRTDTIRPGRKTSATSDDYGDGDLDDDTLVNASFRDLDFDHIENYADPIANITWKNTAKNKATKDKGDRKSNAITQPLDSIAEYVNPEPVQLANGKWACNHSCKDRDACKHMCCKDGMDKPSKKKAVTKRVPSGEDRPEPVQKGLVSKGKETQTKLHPTVSKRKNSAPIDELDLTQQEKKTKADSSRNGHGDYRGLHQLHKSVQDKELPSSLHSVKYTKPAYCYSQGGEHSLGFMSRSTAQRHPTSSDYGDFQFDELSAYFNNSYEESVQHDSQGNMQEPGDLMDYEPAAHAMSHRSDTFGDDDSVFADAIIGLADSENLREMHEGDMDAMRCLERAPDDADVMRYGDEDQMEVDLADVNVNTSQEPYVLFHHDKPHKAPIKVFQSPSVSNTSNFRPELASSIPAKTFTSPNMQQRPITLPHSCSTDDQQLARLEDEPSKDPSVKDRPVPEAFKDLEPWLFQEFGDIVELVDE